MDTNAFFDQPVDTTTETVVAPKESSKKSDLRISMEREFQKTVAENPEIMAALGAKSNTIAVVNTLASETIPNLVQSKSQPMKFSEKAGKEVRNLVPVSGLCGYRIKNLGEEPITYRTCEYAKDENGIYVGTEVEKTAAPGEMFDLNRKYFTIFVSQPQYSFTLANGKVIISKDIDKCMTLDEKLEKPHFQFSTGEDGVTVGVHDDEVKVPVEDASGNVLPEFEKTFGYLYNPTTKTGGRSSSAKHTVSAQELAANYFQSLLQNANGMN